MRLFRAIRNRPFALLWGGQTVSRIGDFLYQVALAWWVLEETGSAAAMSAVLIFSFTPMLLFLLLGGVVVDRYHRVRLMLASDILRGVAVTAVSILALARLLEIWHVYVASLIFGFADAFFQPAYTALIPQITPGEDLPSANSLTSLSVQLGRILGPAAGAGVIAAVGTGGAFAFNGASFFISAAILLPLLRITAPPGPPGEGRSSVVRDLRAGIATVLASPVLWISIICFSLTNVTLAGPYAVAMPFLVKDHLGAEVGTLGLLYSIFPIGYVIGGIWMGRLAKFRRRGPVMYVGLFIASLMLLIFGLSVPLAALVVAALINGAALEVGNLIWVNLLQQVVPGEQLGRVSSIDMLGSFFLLPVGYGLTGWATDLLGAAPVFVLGGGLTAILAAAALLHPAIRSLD